MTAQPTAPLKAGTLVEVQFAVDPNHWYRARVLRWVKYMGPREGHMLHYTPCIDIDPREGGFKPTGMMIPTAALRVIDNRKAA